MNSWSPNPWRDFVTNMPAATDRVRILRIARQLHIGCWFGKPRGPLDGYIGLYVDDLTPDLTDFWEVVNHDRASGA